MSVRVYRFGLLAPIENGDVVHAEMLRAHRWRNERTEIENARRVFIRAVRAEHGHEGELDAAVREADETCKRAALVVKAQRAATRTRREGTAARERLKAARETLKLARAALYAYRTELAKDPALRAAEERINGAPPEKRADGRPMRDSTKKNDGLAAQLVRASRATNGLYWGTGALVDAAIKQAKEQPLYDGTEPNDLRFVRWQGEGRVGVQIQYHPGDPPFGMAEAFGGEDPRVRIEPVDERAWISTVRGERRRLSRTVLWLRVQSTENRKPVWAKWPMVMHRPLPAGAKITHVVVSKRRIGPRDEWAAMFTVASPETTAATKGGCVAVRLGWRKEPSGSVVVADCLDTTGRRFQIRTDARVVSGLDKADEIRAGRDSDFNSARDALAGGLDAVTPPEWLAAATSRLRDWRSPGRLAGLWRRWSASRWAGDEALFEALGAWRYHDHHLWAWEASQRKKTTRRRLDDYRNAAAGLVTRYGDVRIGALDLAKTKQRPRVENEDGGVQILRWLQGVAAPGECRTAIKSASAARGARVEEMPTLGNVCPACAWAATKSDDRKFACGACDYEGDRSEVVLMNMLSAAGHREAVLAMIERWRALVARLRQEPDAAE